MRVAIALVVIGITLLWCPFLNAQPWSGKGAVQFDIGIAHTFHYQHPVMINFCEDGCYPVEQEPRIGKSIDVGYYHMLGQRNEVRLGIGFCEYRFAEKGMASPGDADLLPYQVIVDLNYMTLFAGHRLRLSRQDRKVIPMIENDFYVDLFPPGDHVLKSANFAVKTKLGVFISLEDNLNLVLNGFFKSAIARYNRHESTGDYFPYAYGIEIGLKVGF